MQTFAEEIEIVIAASLLLFLITSFVAVFAIIYERRRRRFIHDKRDMRASFQQEILKSKLEMKESTMHHISQEIHDNIGQLLSLAKLNLSTLSLTESPESEEKLRNAKSLVSKTINELRTLSKTLNSDFLMNESLANLLANEFEALQRLNLFTADFKVVGKEIPIEPQKQLILFRISQETINNAVKHAQPKKIEAILEYQNQKLSLVIKDDGTGFAPPNFTKSQVKKAIGTGLYNLQYRATLIGASLSIDSAPNQGTTVQIDLPL